MSMVSITIIAIIHCHVLLFCFIKTYSFYLCITKISSFCCILWTNIMNICILLLYGCLSLSLFFFFSPLSLLILYDTSPSCITPHSTHVYGTPGGWPWTCGYCCCCYLIIIVACFHSFGARGWWLLAHKLCCCLFVFGLVSRCVRDKKLTMRKK